MSITRFDNIIFKNDAPPCINANTLNSVVSVIKECNNIGATIVYLNKVKSEAEDLNKYINNLPIVQKHTFVPSKDGEIVTVPDSYTIDGLNTTLNWKGYQVTYKIPDYNKVNMTVIYKKHVIRPLDSTYGVVDGFLNNEGVFTVITPVSHTLSEQSHEIIIVRSLFQVV